jgi:signal transduction histidine kinase/ActR/RegA family two-component response regulator
MSEKSVEEERGRSVEALSGDTRMLQLLNETGAALTSTRDLPSLLRTATEAAARLSGAECGAFFAHDASASSPLVAETVCGAATNVHSLAPSLFETLRRTGAPIHCDDALAEATTAEDRAAPTRMRSYLAVPVVDRDGEAIGGLFLSHGAPRAFDERAQHIVTSVAAQAAIALETSRLYQALQRDAAERARLLEAERAARAHAERMSEIKDDFLATLSHELRTPLNAILGWAEVLQSGSRRAADLDKGLEAIARNARMQTQLIEDLLDMSRVASGKLRLQVRPLMPLGVVEAALETVQPAAEAKSIRIDKLLDGAAGPVYGDPGRLQQVVWNLLSNAIKFTPRGGKVRVLLDQDGTHVSITVSDTGIGIRREFLPHVFERFRQGDASTTRTYQGLGLGLAIVKHLIELHGGRVGVHSRGVGTGARFVVQLPLVVRAQAAAPAAASTSSARTTRGGEGVLAAFDLRGVKVLVVDDAADACDLVARALGSCGASVLTAESAQRALALIEAEHPDVLLSDIGMPDMDGFALLKAARALGPHRGGAVPAIAITAYAHNEDRARAAAAGFLLHVVKPAEPAVLAAAVAQVLGRAAGSDSSIA